MRAVLCDRFEGIGALRIGETAEPAPADVEIPIDVHAASASFKDYLMASGGYQMRPTPLCAGNGKRLDLKDRHKLLDVGGGSGVYSIALCAAYPHLMATILDFPDTVDTARLFAAGGWPFRQNFFASCAGNAIKVEWPKGHNVVSVLCPWSERGPGSVPISPILAKHAAEALPLGGLVLMVDDGREGPPFAAWYLGSMFDNPTAMCLTPANVERVLREAGFRIEGTQTMLPGIGIT